LVPQEAPLIDTNFAPLIRPDGSLVGLFRDEGGTGAPHARPTGTNLHLVSASDWRDARTYRESREPIRGGVAGGALGTFDGPEDPTMWVDAEGRLHALFHEWPHPAGPHAFSLDGTEWFWAPGGPDASGNCTEAPCAYTDAMALDDGSRVRATSRERPHLVFDRSGSPIALTNGVCAPQVRSACWTGLQRVAS